MGNDEETAPLSRRAFLDRALAVLLAPGLMGCGRLADGAERGARLAARPGVPTREPARGLSSLGLGSPRDGMLYVPEGYDPGRPVPLFVGLHGAGGEGRHWEGWAERADELGFVLLAPDSRGRSWDLVLGGFGPDVGFVDQALLHTFSRCRIDPARVALGGFSDGASYALSLGASNGDLFSHLVAFSPGFYQPDEARPGSPRVFVSHGRGDRVLSFSRAERSIVPGLRGEGYDVVFVPFDGGHEVPESVSRGALDWLLAGAPAPSQTL